MTSRAKKLPVLGQANLSPYLLGAEGGRNRAAPGIAQIEASNDLEAVSMWLARVTNPHTLRQYRKEIERFLLWCVCELKKPLCAVAVEDAQAYRRFLQNPQPTERWVSNKAFKRNHPDWKPFTGPVTGRSHRQAVVIVGSCFKWLKEVRHLNFNVFDDGLVAVKQRREDLQVGRHLPTEAYEWLANWLDSLPPTPQTIRWRFLAKFLYRSGLRRNEMVTCTMGHFESTGSDNTQTGTFCRRWFLNVVGKGQKPRRVAIADMAPVVEYRRAMGFPTDYPLPGETAPLLLPFRGKECLTPEMVGYEFRKLRKEAVAALLEHLDELPEGEEKLTKQAWLAVVSSVSAHWLRHSHATDAIRNGAEPRLIQLQLGHGKIDTTMVYTHSADAEVWDALAAWLNRAPAPPNT